MRKVHLISVSEPLMLDLALALKEKGYEVSTSGCGLTEDQIHRLEVAGCVYYGDGWFPDRLVNPVYSVVLGSTVLPDNRDGIDDPIHTGVLVSACTYENPGCRGWHKGETIHFGDDHVGS